MRSDGRAPRAPARRRRRRRRPRPTACAGSSARRRARSSGEASRYIFTSASGNTTVPMSRPSMTTPPSGRMRAAARPGPRAPADAARRWPAAAIDVRRADRLRDVVAVDRRRGRRPRARRARATRRDGVRVRRDRRRLRRLPRHGAVHRAGVHVTVAETLGDRARDGALAGPGRAVDGDDETACASCDPLLLPGCRRGTSAMRAIAVVARGARRRRRWPGARCPTSQRRVPARPARRRARRPRAGMPVARRDVDDRATSAISDALTAPVAGAALSRPTDGAPAARRVPRRARRAASTSRGSRRSRAGSRRRARAS